jgi:hypothetical protein
MITTSEKIVYTIIIIAFIVFFFVIGFERGINHEKQKIHQCSVHKEFRETDTPSEEYCVKWRELERISKGE